MSMTPLVILHLNISNIILPTILILPRESMALKIYPIHWRLQKAQYEIQLKLCQDFKLLKFILAAHLTSTFCASLCLLGCDQNCSAVYRVPCTVYCVPRTAYHVTCPLCYILSRESACGSSLITNAQLKALRCWNNMMREGWRWRSTEIHRKYECVWLSVCVWERVIHLVL